jgi:hypothetical protein
MVLRSYFLAHISYVFSGFLHTNCEENASTMESWSKKHFNKNTHYCKSIEYDKMMGGNEGTRYLRVCEEKLFSPN